MIQIEIQPPPNIDRILRVLNTLPQGIERAGKSALSRTMKGTKRAARQKVSQRYVVTADFVMGTVSSSITGLNAEMKSKGNRTPLERFKINPKVRQNPAPPGGVFAQVVRGQGGTLKRAFLQRNGGVYERISAARFPIKRLKSLAPPQMLSSPPVSSFIVKKMQELLSKNLEQAMQAILGGFI